MISGKSHANSSYYDKDEEIKIHFYDDGNNTNNKKILNEKLNKINKKLKNIGINNQKLNYYINIFLY